MEGPTVRTRSERRRRGAEVRGRSIILVAALLALSVLGAPTAAAAQAEQTDPSAPSSSVASPEEPPGTTVPGDTTTTTAPEEPGDTTVPEEDDEDGVPGESTGPEEPVATDDEDGTDPVDALTWAAIGLTLLLLGVGVGWMLRRPPRPSGPPSDADWPGSGDLV